MTVPERCCPWCGRVMRGAIDLTDHRVGHWWCRRCFRSYWAVRRPRRLATVIDLRAARERREAGHRRATG